MKPLRISLSIITILFIISSIGFAGDYGWMRDFNIQAEADPSGLRARLEARFQVGEMEMEVILDSVDKPADAYMLLRLGEISNQSIDHVLAKHKAQKGKGWGTLARSLGIKPGSRDFHDLKQGQDIYADRGNGKDRVKCKGKAKKK